MFKITVKKIKISFKESVRFESKQGPIVVISYSWSQQSLNCSHQSRKRREIAHFKRNGLKRRLSS